MYAEQYGVSAVLEEPAKWLQWADAGEASQSRILAPENAGIGQWDDSARDGGKLDQTIRYNLNQFWASKNRLYPTVSPDLQAQLVKLDALAHGVWGRLENKEAVSADTDSTSRAQHASASAQAFAIAAQLQQIATSGVVTKQVKSYQNQASDPQSTAAWMNANTPDDRYSTAFLDQAKKVATLPVLGVPLWVWGAGAVALLLLVETGPSIAAARVADRYE